MKKLAAIICMLAFVSALAMTGCTSSAATNNTNNGNAANTNVNTAANTQTPLSIKETKALYVFDKGDVAVREDGLVVSLEGNPTTGFEWTYGIEGSTVEAVSDTYSSKAQAQPTTGAGGIYTFEFKAAGTGSSTINFTYARSWEKRESDSWVKIVVTTNNGKVTDTVTTSSDGSGGESHD